MEGNNPVSLITRSNMWHRH